MRRSIAILGGLGVVALVAALLWVLIAPGQLVKYPADLNKTAVATGTVSVFVDPATGAPSSAAQTLPLTIRRTLKVVDSTGSTATVQETSTEQIGGTTAADPLLQRYVIDRASLRNLADRRAYAYTPANITNRSPAYSINLPFATGDGPYALWKNETASAYSFRRSGSDIERDGLTLIPMSGKLSNVPATAAYIKQLAPQGVHSEMTLAQLAPLLKAQGVDPALLTDKLLPALAPAERRALQAMLTAPIPIKYFVSGDARLLVEPTTGAIVSLDSVDQTLSAVPDLKGLAALQTVLKQPKYADNPVVQGTLTALAGLSPAPVRVLRLQYQQTPASVADIAAYTQDKADGIRLVTSVIPLGLSILGVIFLLGSLAAYLVRKEPARVSAAS